MKIDIPNVGKLALEHLVMDMNGTIATSGVIHEDLRPLLDIIKKSNILELHVLTADTFGTAVNMVKSFGLECHVLPRKKVEAEEKLDYINTLGSEKCIVMGNGNNDYLMIQNAGLGICVLGHEGAATQCLISADLVVQDPKDALLMILNPERMVATLRR
ncbi:MAG: haloacid dehalogenase [Candidatus Lokiarchaeota archaeon]|nr:haloacid dehalogenase [Candidatus Lokiarchaeota archaeon]